MKTYLIGNLLSRTAWLGALVIILGTLYDQWSLVAELIPDGWETKGYALIGLLIIVLRNVTSESIEDKAVRIADVDPGFGARSPALVGGLALLVACATLAGCVTNPATGERELTESGKAALQEVAALAIARYVEQSDGGAVQVERLRSALEELEALPDLTTVDGLHALIQARIDQKVEDPFDRAQLTRLNTLIAAMLTDSVGRDLLDPAAAVRVREFLAYLAAVLPPPR